MTYLRPRCFAELDDNPRAERRAFRGVDKGAWQSAAKPCCAGITYLRPRCGVQLDEEPQSGVVRI